MCPPKAVSCKQSSLASSLRGRAARVQPQQAKGKTSSRFCSLRVHVALLALSIDNPKRDFLQSGDKSLLRDLAFVLFTERVELT